MSELAKNQLHTVVITGYAAEGLGVARINGQVVFVHGAVRGELCMIRILKVLKNAAFARVEEIVERSPARVEAFCSELGIRYVGHAGKPSRRGYREAMALAGVPPERTAMLGDKLLTDVLGAKRSGVLALMVEPLGGPAGAWNHVLHGLQRPFKWIAKRRCTKL